VRRRNQQQKQNRPQKRYPYQRGKRRSNWKNLQAINKKLGDFLYSILQKDYEKTPSTKSRKIAEMVKEYRFDYGKAKPNRFASRMKDAPLVAVIDSDMAKVFTTAEQVNKALRAVISAMPEK
jgi:hypothetical protein